MTMKKETHHFIRQYSGLAAFGLDDDTDRETLKFYLQKFSEDRFMDLLVPRLSSDEVEGLYTLINTLLKRHLTEDEYHCVFLKDRE